MAQYQIPELPAFFRASELLHGENDGFIINAYLALQRHWPDNGGFFHYQDLLRRDPSHRPEVLRTDRQSTRLNSSHVALSRMPSSA